MVSARSVNASHEATCTDDIPLVDRTLYCRRCAVLYCTEGLEDSYTATMNMCCTVSSLTLPGSLWPLPGTLRLSNPLLNVKVNFEDKNVVPCCRKLLAYCVSDCEFDVDYQQAICSHSHISMTRGHSSLGQCNLTKKSLYAYRYINRGVVHCLVASTSSLVCNYTEAGWAGGCAVVCKGSIGISSDCDRVCGCDSSACDRVCGCD